MNYVTIPSPPETYIGWESRHKLKELLKTILIDKILIIADPVLISLDLIKEITAPLEEENYNYTIYSNLIPEPTLETGQHVVDFARSGNYSLIIGFGGGSAIDMAKLAAVFATNDGQVADYLNLSANRKIEKRGLPKLFIPTTSGTGTEVTNISVLALEKTKDVIVHNYLLADFVIVDPYFTLTLPPRHTAATGADALTHAIEAFLSVNSNPYSDGLALQAIRLIGSSLVKGVKDGNDKDARLNLSYGSYLAGLAFFNAGVGAIHALAYPLGGQFHLAHGESNAVLIPYVLAFIKNTCSSKLAIISEALGYPAGTLNEETAAQQCIQVLAKMMQEIGIPSKLGDFNIPESAAETLAEDGILQKRLLARCPMELTKEHIFKIYKTAFEGNIAAN